MKLSGRNQSSGPGPSTLAAAEAGPSAPLLGACAAPRTERVVLLLLTCCWLSSFSSGASLLARVSTNSGYSSPGCGKVYCVTPDGLYR